MTMYVYRPVEIEVRMTLTEAKKLLPYVEAFPNLEAAIADAIEHRQGWGQYPPPFRALVVGLEGDENASAFTS